MTMRMTLTPGSAHRSICVVEVPVHRQGQPTVWVSMPCVPVGEFFAAAPAVKLLPDGGVTLAGGWVPWHRPSGTHVCPPHGTCCLWCARQIAEAMTALPVDWATADRDSLPADLLPRMHEIARIALRCPAGDCQAEADALAEEAADDWSEAA